MFFSPFIFIYIILSHRKGFVNNYFLHERFLIFLTKDKQRICAIYRHIPAVLFKYFQLALETLRLYMLLLQH